MRGCGIIGADECVGEELANNEGALIEEHHPTWPVALSVASGCSPVLCWLWEGVEKPSGLGASRSACSW